MVRQAVGQSHIVIVALVHQLSLGEHGLPHGPCAFDDYYFTMRPTDLIGKRPVDVFIYHRNRLYILGKKNTLYVSFLVHSMMKIEVKCL